MKTLQDGTVPVIILGGHGYVSGELLRLLSLHPRFHVVACMSSSHPGERLGAVFPHLAGVIDDATVFESMTALARIMDLYRSVGIFAATPHGATAAVVSEVLGTANKIGANAKVVDLSADFRFPKADEYEAIYGRAHGAPELLPSFVCAVPEHLPGKPKEHATQPGCFTTSVVLAAYPFFALNLVDDDIFVSAVTGSSGSGRSLGTGTHHPERRSTLHAYSPLGHRHEHEMVRLIGLARDGANPHVDFVPHSGPFVRGIHATLRLTLRDDWPADELVAKVNAFYGADSFVHASVTQPKLTEVVGTNRCRIGVSARKRVLVVTSVIDNLVKGAAGGAIQWMNRLFDLPQDTGLRLPGLGWY